MKLMNQIEELRELVIFNEKSKPEISKSSVGWHLDHCLLVIERILEVVNQSAPERCKSNFNPLTHLLLITGKINRGRAQSPKIVLPGKFNEEEMHKRLHDFKSIIKKSKEWDAKKHFTHPYLGVLNLKRTHKFLEIHTKHHVDIIHDILSD
jgi:hypothetical protein